MPEGGSHDEELPGLPQVLPPEEASIAASGETDDKAVKEEAFFEERLSKHRVDAAELRNELARAYIDNLKADRGMRQTYAGRILRYLEYYSIGVAVLLVLDGSKVGGFDLDETVVTALVGSTALAAIGLVGFIARGLFRAPPPLPTEND